MKNNTKKLLVLCGATATGKTSLAITVAQYFKTEIISFDSRQCYKELNIGVAKPTAEELKLVPHHFINSHSIHEKLNAALYEKYALHQLATIFEKNDIAIAVGGTGLYLNALCQSVDDIPEIPAVLRNELQKQLEEKGLEWLKNEILQKDKSFVDNNDLHNTQRMLRALEVVLHTGKSIKFYQQNKKVERDFTIIKFNVVVERQLLYQRINNRVDKMMEDGLLDEVKKVQPFKLLNALQTVGYSELFSYLTGEIKLETSVELIKQHTRNYAKRQVTWFKKDTAIILNNDAENSNAKLLKIILENVD